MKYISHELEKIFFVSKYKNVKSNMKRIEINGKKINK